MFGNGLRKDIWETFVDRFGIQDVTEFYAATEGNCNVANFMNVVGCVGFLLVAQPKFIRDGIQFLYLIKVDRDTGEPVRDENGFCVECKPGMKEPSSEPYLLSNEFCVQMSQENSLEVSCQETQSGISRGTRTTALRRRRFCAMFSRKAIDSSGAAIFSFRMNLVTFTSRTELEIHSGKRSHNRASFVPIPGGGPPGGGGGGGWGWGGGMRIRSAPRDAPGQH